MDTDLQEIIKEISIMQQCDSQYIVKYYGSYFKNTDLWVKILHHHWNVIPLHKSGSIVFGSIDIKNGKKKYLKKLHADRFQYYECEFLI